LIIFQRVLSCAVVAMQWSTADMFAGVGIFPPNLQVLHDTESTAPPAAVIESNDNPRLFASFKTVRGHRNTIRGVGNWVYGDDNTVNGMNCTVYGNNNSLEGTGHTAYGEGNSEAGVSSMNEFLPAPAQAPPVARNTSSVRPTHPFSGRPFRLPPPALQTTAARRQTRERTRVATQTKAAGKRKNKSQKRKKEDGDEREGAVETEEKE
jgi:hypothetical protein